jgi:hypothetical protein
LNGKAREALPLEGGRRRVGVKGLRSIAKRLRKPPHPGPLLLREERR